MRLASPPPQPALQERRELQLRSSWRDPPKGRYDQYKHPRCTGGACLGGVCSLREAAPNSARRRAGKAAGPAVAGGWAAAGSRCPLPVWDVLSFPVSAARAASSSPRFGRCPLTPRDGPTGKSPGRNNLFFACIWDKQGGEKKPHHSS